MDILNNLLNNWQSYLGAVSAVLVAAIAVASLIPGDQPETSLHDLPQREATTAQVLTLEDKLFQQEFSFLFLGFKTQSFYCINLFISCRASIILFLT